MEGFLGLGERFDPEVRQNLNWVFFKEGVRVLLRLRWLRTAVQVVGEMARGGGESVDKVFDF